MDGLVKPYKIFNKNRVGVFGIGIELDGLVDKKCIKKRFITILSKPPRRWSNIKKRTEMRPDHLPFPSRLYYKTSLIKFAIYN
jgi:5'-nucleotidase